ncbi:MAG: hypothetical protein PHP82_02310 [Candidatus ainarchaeum sp.]|nr:hypothetical protein [Candidatus ainarchaeum sp.]
MIYVFLLVILIIIVLLFFFKIALEQRNNEFIQKQKYFDKNNDF